MSQNNQWQARTGRYDLSQFRIDWTAQVAICPEGKTSVKWTPGTDQHGHPNVSVRFELHKCLACPARSLCTRSQCSPRMLTIRQQAEFEALHHARKQQQSREFRQISAQRSGIDGTPSQGVRSLGLRRTRYVGLAKTSLPHLFTAAAMNLIRIDAFLERKKVTKTRISRFATLAPVGIAC